MLLDIIHSSNQSQKSLREQDHEISAVSPSLGDLQSHIAESYKMVSALYGPFKTKVKEQVTDYALNTAELLKSCCAAWRDLKVTG